MYQIGISTIDIYFNNIRKILDSVNDFCKDIEHENRNSILEEKPNPELDDTIKQIKNIKIKGEDDKEVTRKKVIGFYTKNQFISCQLIKFLPIF